MAIDSSGGKWIATYQNGALYIDDNGTPAEKSDDTVVRFDTTDGLVSNSLGMVTIDSNGRKWFTTGYSGLTCLDDKGTPFDAGDDEWYRYTETEGKL